MSSEFLGLPATEDESDSRVSGYFREGLEKELRDGFRKQQQRVNKDRQVEQLALAKGLGEEAVTSLKEGSYIPHKVLPPLKPEEKRFFERIDFRKWHQHTDQKLEDAADLLLPMVGECSAAQQPIQVQEHQTATGTDVEDPNNTSLSTTPSSLVALKADSGEDAQCFLRKLRFTSRATASLCDARAEVEDNIQAVEEALLQQSAPLSFSELLDTAASLLAAMERGKLTENLEVPRGVEVRTESDERMPRTPVDSAETLLPASSPTTRLLHGAVEVEEYARQHLLPKAYQVVAVAHTAEWILQYTMVYLRTTMAVNKDEAFTRLTLLARCVRLLGGIENFSSVLLSLETKCEEYAGVVALKDTAECHLETLLDEVESALDAVLRAPFPSRRTRLLQVERGVSKQLHRALLLLNEIDHSWTPHVHFHWAWKVQLLTTSFHRIHGPISQKYMQCSMGFIDNSLYEKVADTRITGRYMGASPIQPKVPRAQQVEYEKISEGLTLQQIGMSVKGLASLIVGKQLCMGARYILRQSTKDFDSVWGFRMDEVNTSTTEEELCETVTKMAAHAKQQFTARMSRKKMPPSSTFLTAM
ncbi:conserved hypothetical protein [Leishmania braziliensis MHOM/BR/75/M2904]|uniref:Uncharacterized protein n=2 Tax=Leishmania braziliensis TaxID=5660 RepID=A4HB35_LEIBR|nr:conserved hypothetical protein [Leishmania braziliensis MHOM/BR/75/M2904]KAI5686545.1 hypothetical protein MNV84_03174 [Leishmania braziliensis]CAJ2471513.1 unnamed protein product [Leishmania braziliensis]CAM38620.1 conserved hypothetical protein [Leishmania braziliensis MHOM/BR/75/M2904]SYZ65315.1 hypothetical_protein [Leishmania braziliensis MHOM/BR/75/M2904]